MGLEKQPFVSYTLDQEKPDPLEKGKVFTLRLNAKEYQQLKEDMKMLHCTSESTTIKKLAEAGRNVLHSTLGVKILAWISDPSRRTREET